MMTPAQIKQEIANMVVDPDPDVRMMGQALKIHADANSNHAPAVKKRVDSFLSILDCFREQLVKPT